MPYTKWLWSALLLTLLALGSTASATAAPSSELFVIARSKNANVVRYSARLGKAGQLNVSEPLEAYWLMRAEDGRREELSWAERRLAYGFSVSGATAKGFTLKLIAFEGRAISVEQSPAGFRALVAIAGKPAVLRRIFVRTREGGIVPSVQYVELFGTTLSGAPVSERITAE